MAAKFSTLICAVFLGFNVNLTAQETLFNSVSHVTGFGGPILEISNIDGDISAGSGGGGAFIIDNFFIGGYGIGNDDIDNKNWEGESYSVDFGHGGLWLGYTSNRKALVHLQASLRIGGGSVDVFQLNRDRFEREDAVFVLTPNVGGEVNITNWFKISAGIGYRWTNGVNNTLDYSDSDLSSLNGEIVLKFGWFKEDD